MSAAAATAAGVIKTRTFVWGIVIVSILRSLKLFPLLNVQENRNLKNNLRIENRPFAADIAARTPESNGAGSRIRAQQQQEEVSSAENNDTSNTDGAQAPQGPIGIDLVYLKLFEEAKRRSEQDHETSHMLGGCGIVIGPTEGKFKHYTVTALQNGKRIRAILDRNPDNDIKLALMTSPEHVALLNKCLDDPSSAIDEDGFEEACRLWGNATLFDHVIATEDAPYKHNDLHTNLDQGSSKYWLKALGGYRLAPYRETLFLDSDSYPCPGFEQLFLLSDPNGGGNFGKYWQLPVAAPGDLAIGVDQYANWQNGQWIPSDPQLLQDLVRFAERNTGAVLFSFHRPMISHTLAHFIPLVSEHVYNNVATPEKKVVNDQCPFRMALYLFHRLVPEFVEHQIPMHSSCRTYPGHSYTGTDGFLNGMYPIQKDGQHCSQCACTPCLINHNARSWNVYLNNNTQMGWEGDFSWQDQQPPVTDKIRL